MNTARQDPQAQGDQMKSIKANFPGMQKVLKDRGEPENIKEEGYDKNKDFKSYRGSSYSGQANIFDSDGSEIGSCNIGASHADNETLEEAVHRLAQEGKTPSFAIIIAEAGAENWTVVAIPSDLD